jgi:hypothetical protein
LQDLFVDVDSILWPFEQSKEVFDGVGPTLGRNARMRLGSTFGLIDNSESLEDGLLWVTLLANLRPSMASIPDTPAPREPPSIRHFRPCHRRS